MKEIKKQVQDYIYSFFINSLVTLYGVNNSILSFQRLSSSPIDSGFIPYPIDTIPPIYYYDLPEDPVPGSEGARDSTGERGGGTVGERGNGSSGWSVGGGSGSSSSTPTNTGTSTSTRLKDVHFDYPASKFPGYGTDGMDCYKLSDYILRQLMGAQTNVGDLSHAYFIKKKING